jgi:hypothetical protein
MLMTTITADNPISPLKVIVLEPGQAPIFELEPNLKVNTYIDHDCLGQLRSGPRGVFTLPMHPIPDIDTEVPSKRAIAMIEAIVGSMVPICMTSKDASDVVYGGWGNSFGTLVGPGVALPPNRFWGTIFASELPPGVVVCVHHNAGALVYNRLDVESHVILGVSFAVTGGAIVERGVIPARSFGGFINPKLIQVFKVDG